MATPLAPIEPLEHLADDELAELRAQLEACGFEGGIFAEIESILPTSADAARLPLIRWTLARRAEPWAAVARLFVYADAVPEELVRERLGARTTGALLGAGALAPATGLTGALVSRVRVMPFLGLWIMGDPPDGGAEAAMIPGRTTMQAALLMPARLEGEVLDLGCGPGTLALVAAHQGARRAVGTDINARAVAFARLNGRLNGVAAEFHAGDLYEPVRGRRFDLVVAQPPYVIQPEHTGAVTYLHGGPRGEDLVLRALADLPAMLAPGGRSIMLVDVPLPAGEPLAAHYRRALGDPSVDLVLALGPAAPPEVQAFAYAQLEDGALGPRYTETAARYLEHLSSLETPGFRHAAVLVRRPHAGRPAEALTATFPVSGFGGADSRSADDLLAAIDLAAAPPDALRRAGVVLSPRARWTIESDGPVPEDGIRWQVRFAPGALAVDQEVSEASAVLLHCMSTAEDVEAGLGAYAEACDARAEEVAPQAIEFVRHALRSGLLEPRSAER